MPEAPAPDPKKWNPAHAVITQVGRWRYSIYISYGLLRYDGEFGTYRYGYKRAQKKAERMLAEVLLQGKRYSNVTELYPAKEN
jgi:hypothetical protein